MSNGQYRYVWRIVLENFIKSFKPRQIRGNHMGADYMGNKYFELPARPAEGKRKPTRWYDPPKGSKDYIPDEPIPAEWEAWLRMRRPDPPTEQEIAANIAMAKLKQKNAAIIETKRLADGGSLPTIPTKGPQSFPTYRDIHPGDPENIPDKTKHRRE